MRLLALSIVASFAFAIPALTQQNLRQAQVIAVPGVQGRIDHLSVDLKGGRLFVSALGNNTVEVLDLKAGRRIHEIASVHEPQGVLFVPDVNRIFVANGADGSVMSFDGASYRLLGTIHFGSDADNLRYDPATRQVWVGYGQGAMGIVDATTGRRLGDIALEGHPESFQLEPGGARIFVNVPTAQQIAVVDRAKRAVIATWPLTEAQANFPMALNEEDHRLLVVARRPARLLVIDTGTGKVRSSEPCVGDADDLFYDIDKHRAYVSGGEGFVDIFERTDPDHYRRLDRISTVAGARTSFFSLALGRFFLAVPHRGSQEAEIRVYSVGPLPPA